MFYQSVSVIIPAHNAATTIAETLESLIAQTFLNWEAIIINDGSVDKTATISAQFAAQDKRIQVVNQSQAGVCIARNHGIQLAQFDWLLFLDADDWIAPYYLERMMEALSADPTLDGIYCNWARVAPNGQLLEETCRFSPNELFAGLARTCTFAIHACIIKRTFVQAVGNFDPSLETCEEWDLWQRLARSGAHFGKLDEILTYYRMSPQSVSTKGLQLAKDAMRVITQGHAPDARVLAPHPAYTSGQPATQLSAAKLEWIAWAAGLLLGSGEDALPLLELLKEDREPGLDCHYIAYSIFYAAMLPTCQAPTAWFQRWEEVEPKLRTFLQALETQSTTSGLAKRSQTILERLILNCWEGSLPVVVGETYAIQLDATKPIPDIYPPAAVDRLHCTIELEGKKLGTLELPVCRGWVASFVLTDAIAAEFFWTILNRFFERTIYCHDLQKRNIDHLDGLTSAQIAQSTAEVQTLHNEIGWTVTLQELWGHPNWKLEHFYNPHFEHETTNHHALNDNWFVVEISDELPHITASTPELDITLTVGGVAIGLITVPVEQNFVTAQALQVALTTGSELELCIACVREGLIGRPISDPTPLRSRLAEAAAKNHHLNKERNTTSLVHPSSLSYLHQVRKDVEPNGSILIIGRRSGAMATSASRRMMFPIEASHEMLLASEIAGEPVLSTGSLSQSPIHGIYAPDLIRQTCSHSVNSPTARTVASTPALDRSYFETMFAAQSYPWQYATAYEQVKYEQTLSLLPSEQIGKALELACAEGHFTVQLAPHVQNLVAADISQIALERTAERCKGLHNVQFMQVNLTCDSLPEAIDLIVCSEVLYYIGTREDLSSIAQKLASALTQSGYLLMAHANLVVDEPTQCGFNWDLPFGAKAISEAFLSNPLLHLVKEIRTPLYRIQLFQRYIQEQSSLNLPEPEIIQFQQPPALPIPEVAAGILWEGGQPQRTCDNHTVVTERLPILMYHRIAPTGSDEMSRYRVTPTAFEEQLKYLHDCGFYTVSWEEWRQAMWRRQPLPGRAIAITFDDGYLDFFEYAYPLLKHYGFSATVFLVSEQIGKSNYWDSVYGETVRLMDWQHIHQLQQEGIEFGSHTVSHRQLTALSTTEVVKEGARSRAILERFLEKRIRAFAYPYGDFDPIVQHLIGACGYTIGLSCRSGLSSFNDSLLALPRLEIKGSDNLQDFILKLK